MVAILLGAMVTLAFPPFFIFPAAITGFAGFFLILETCTRKREAFTTGWCFGFGHFVSGLYWIANSLLVDAEMFAWLVPFAISIIPAGLAIYTGLVALAAHLIPRNITRWRRIMGFTCFWVITELLRAHLFTGFPWNLMGYIWTVSEAMMQPAAAIGVYGLSLLAVFSATLPAVLVKITPEQRVIYTRDWKPITFTFSILALIFAFGNSVILVGQKREFDKLNVRIIQPSIPQTMKMNPDEQAQNFLKHIELTKQKSEVEGFAPDVVVWPEAVVSILDEDAQARQIMADSIPDGSYIIAGTMRRAIGEDEQIKIWNSVQVVNSAGDIAATYDKHHLVPFGEYIPLRFLANFIARGVATEMMDFSKGSGAQTVYTAGGGLPAFSPMICYEAIFSAYVVERRRNNKRDIMVIDMDEPVEGNKQAADDGHKVTIGEFHDAAEIIRRRNAKPKWLVNTTNDAWFGDSTGPHQHFHMTRMRAVEERLPLVRAANNGISAAIDSYGRVIDSLDLNEVGIIDITLPLPADRNLRNRNLYARHGEVAPISLIALLLVISFRSRRAKLPAAT